VNYVHWVGQKGGRKRVGIFIQRLTPKETAFPSGKPKGNERRGPRENRKGG